MQTPVFRASEGNEQNAEKESNRNQNQGNYDHGPVGLAAFALQHIVGEPISTIPAQDKDQW
jgi:hypothetical protein